MQHGALELTTGCFNTTITRGDIPTAPIRGSTMYQAPKISVLTFSKLRSRD